MPIKYRRQQGMVLPFTLIILAILLIMASLMMQRSDGLLNQVHAERQLWQARLNIHSAEQRVQFAMLVGVQEPGGYRLGDTFVPIDGTPLLLSNQVTVRVQDQAGLLSLFYIRKDLLRTLLAYYYPLPEAEQLLNDIIAWQNIYADPPMGRAAPMRSLDELMRLPGVTPGQFNGNEETPGLSDYLVLSGSSWINYGAIPLPLMQILHGLSQQELSAFGRARESGQWRTAQQWLFEHGLGGAGNELTPSSRYIINYEYNGLRARGDYQIRAQAGTPARRRAWMFPHVPRAYRISNENNEFN